MIPAVGGPVVSESILAMVAGVEHTVPTTQASRTACNWRDVEECFRLARIALGISDRTESLWLTREALDLTAHVLGDYDHEVG